MREFTELQTSANTQRSQGHIQRVAFTVTATAISNRQIKATRYDFVFSPNNQELLTEQLKTDTRATNVTHTANIVKIANIVIWCIVDSSLLQIR